MTRERKGGTEQNGMMKGMRLTYDRIKPAAWYVGADIFTAEGPLQGHNARGRTLNSTIKDTIYEGRLGFTLCHGGPRRTFITPFGGYGYFRETNKFRDPSPIPYTFVETFNYIAVGFLSGVNFTPLLSMGVNFKVEFMLNGKSHVKDDPLQEPINLKFKNEINTRLEIPLIYRFSAWKRRFSAIVAPFYEFRHFGGQQGFPFDYIDTKFYLIGARASLGFAF